MSEKRADASPGAVLEGKAKRSQGPGVFPGLPYNLRLVPVTSLPPFPTHQATTYLLSWAEINPSESQEIDGADPSLNDWMGTDNNRPNGRLGPSGAAPLPPETALCPEEGEVGQPEVLAITTGIVM